MTTVSHLTHVEGYERFFGLNEPPFSVAPDPRFVFESASHAAALAQLLYALERREPLVVITGEIGAGKTLLCRTVVHRLQRKTFLSVINDPLLDCDDLLKQLLEDFGVISKDRSKLTATSRHELFHALQGFLASLVPLQAHAVVIIDEAQHLQPDVLEQIRLLSNIDDEHGTLLQIILVGQTDMERLLSRPELRQFQQRVSRRFRLEPLSADEIQQYIDHRLAVARGHALSRLPGGIELEREVAQWGITNASVPFTPDAIQEVAKFSAGLPRVINIVCDRALEAAYTQRLRKIDLQVINTAARVLGLAVPPPAPQPGPSGVAPARAFATAVGEPTKPNDAAKAVGPVVAAGEPAPARQPVERLGHVDRSVPVAFGTLTQPSAASARRTWLVLASPLVLLAAVAIWFGARAMNPPAQPVAPPVTIELQADAPAPSTSTVSEPSGLPPSAPAPGAPDAPVPTAVSESGTAPATTAVAPPAAAAPTTGERFEIVVASFRTDARATSVAVDVAALGLPMRRRVADGWQQVLAGPFVSRADAVAAQQRLDRAGLTGTQIVPMVR